MAANMQSKFEKEIQSLDAYQRIKKAKKVIEELTNRIDHVISLHVANEIIQYSGTLTGQIPESQAAWAFNTFQEAMMSQEIIKLMGLWDKPGDNAYSIPTAIAYIDSDEVIAKLSADIIRHYQSSSPRNLTPSDDPDIQAAMEQSMRDRSISLGQNQAQKLDVGIRNCIEESKKIQKNPTTVSVENQRHHMAHQLSKTRKEKSKPVPKMKYGDESELFETTLRLIEELYRWVNGTSYDLQGSAVNLLRKRTQELWLNCRFEIPVDRDIEE